MDGALSPGLAANTAAVLAMSLGHRVQGLIGSDLPDGNGNNHLGITNTPIPILTATAGQVKEIREQAAGDDRLLVVDFTDHAQRSTTYDAYADALRDATGESITYLGVALYGPSKPVLRLTGSLALLR